MAAPGAPCTAAEQWNFANAACFRDFRCAAAMPPWQRGASTTVAQPNLDVYGTTLDQAFDLDTPVAPTLMPR